MTSIPPPAHPQGEAPLLLKNVRVPAPLLASAPPAYGALCRLDLRIAGGLFHAIGPAGALAPHEGETVRDCEDGLALPCFTDLHTHLDKGHIAPRKANPDGSFMGALNAVMADRAAHWTAGDVEARMEFALSCAYAHGTAAIRTHLDSTPPQHAISWPVFDRLRERWAGRIELQATALIGPEHALDEGLLEEIAATAKARGGLLGGAISVFDRAPDAVRATIEAAGRHGLDIDLHIDESEDPQSRSLRALADAVIDTGFAGKVLAGHCCSLAVQDEAFAKETIARVARAGIAIVSLPMCNLYLQDRHNDAFLRTPRWRGITLVNELKAAGVAVSLSSDNTRDPFYAYGDLDMIEVFRESARIGHFDHPVEHAFDWLRAVTAIPAATGGFAHKATIAVGAAADLVLCRARTFSELMSRPQSDRIVIRAGRAIEARVPDYRDLDAILGVFP